MATFLIGGGLTLLVGMAVRHLLWRRKTGIGGCGCSCHSCPYAEGEDESRRDSPIDPIERRRTHLG